VAKKRRKKPYRPPAATTEEPAQATTTKTRARARASTASGISAASVARRDRKEEARRQRDAALRQMRRQALIRRVVTFSIIAAVIAAGVAFFLIRSQQRDRTINSANEIAAAAGCTEVQTQPSRGNTHINAPEPITYTDQPPTSGNHRPAPLDGNVHVYQVEPDVTQAVHNLEHAYFVMWYRADGEGALDQAIVEELERFAEATTKTIIAPYGQLPDGVSLAFTGWTKLQTCPTGADLSPEDALTLAEAFSLVGRTEAPEPQGV
jgi:Protein of unknown function (DUF3105)